MISAGMACMLVSSCGTTASSFTPKASDKPISILERGTTLGDPRAAVVIEEYSDFQCPFCKEYSDKIEPKILEEYVVTGKVRVLYHTFGNWVSRKAEGNTESSRTAEAAQFAADHNRFWQLRDAFFELQGRPNSGVFSDETIIAAAVQVGLNGERLRADLAAHAYASRVQREYDEGIARGVTSTPTFFVNRFKVVGAQPYEVFKSAIDDALRAAGEST
jgi:protein-disulfide isomerase